MDSYRTSEKHCAYCGKAVANPEREHVFPRCLYPKSKKKSKVRRLTIPACHDCNNSLADDEAHFRNMLIIAGENPNTARSELWDTRIRPSFDEVDGHRRKHELVTKLRLIKVGDEDRYMVFPGEDDRVLRVVRKIIRGLCHYHAVMSPVSDRRVWTTILKYVVPKEFLDEMNCCHREKDIVEYKYQVLNYDGINSVWIITFFERVSFIGIVSMSESGYEPKIEASTA